MSEEDKKKPTGSGSELKFFLEPEILFQSFVLPKKKKKKKKNCMKSKLMKKKVHHMAALKRFLFV